MASKWFQTAPIRSWVISYMKCFYLRPLSGVVLPYPVYFGYDAKGEVCAVYVRFIDIEASYKEQA